MDKIDNALRLRFSTMNGQHLIEVLRRWMVDFQQKGWGAEIPSAFAQAMYKSGPIERQRARVRAALATQNHDNSTDTALVALDFLLGLFSEVTPGEAPECLTVCQICGHMDPHAELERHRCHCGGELWFYEQSPVQLDLHPASGETDE